MDSPCLKTQKSMFDKTDMHFHKFYAVAAIFDFKILRHYGISNHLSAWHTVDLNSAPFETPETPACHKFAQNTTIAFNVLIFFNPA